MGSSAIGERGARGAAGVAGISSATVMPGGMLRMRAGVVTRACAGGGGPLPLPEPEPVPYPTPVPLPEAFLDFRPDFARGARSSDGEDIAFTVTAAP